MAQLQFWKLQSIGNDFPLLHTEDVRNLDAENLDSNLIKISIQLCDRHFGVGGDGLLTVEMEEGTVRLRMFNPDGTEDFCGNGIRCAARHVFDLGWVGAEFSVRHLDREVPVSVAADGEITTTLGYASYAPEDVPHTAYGELFNTTIWSGMDGGQPISLFGSALTTGSTHTIIPTSELPDDDSFTSVSAQIEVAPLFPDRTSVIWRQEVGPDHLKLRIWERGVGETLGCGTGASAAAVDYLRRKRRGGTVTVESRGGTLRVAAESAGGHISLIGTAHPVFSGVVAVPVLPVSPQPPTRSGSATGLDQLTTKCRA